jgi:hypothetical protein
MMNEEDNESPIDNLSVEKRVKFEKEDSKETALWAKHARETVQDFTFYGTMIENKFKDLDEKPKPAPI